jgi:hypothetical protein
MHRCCYSCCFNNELEPESHEVQKDTKKSLLLPSLAVNILECYLGTPDITTNVSSFFLHTSYQDDMRYNLIK